MSWEEEPTGGGGAEQGTEMGEGRPRRARGALPAPTTRPHPSLSYPRAVPAPRVRRDEGLPLRRAEARGLGRRRVAAREEEEEDCKAALLARQRRSSPGGTHEAPGASASGHPSFGNEMCAMPALLPAAPPPRPLLLHRSICSSRPGGSTQGRKRSSRQILHFAETLESRPYLALSQVSFKLTLVDPLHTCAELCPTLQKPT